MKTKKQIRKHFADIGAKNSKLLSQIEIPKRLEKNGVVFEQNEYGSYCNIQEYGMIAQKNAMSLIDLLNLGYKPIKN